MSIEGCSVDYTRLPLPVNPSVPAVEAVECPERCTGAIVSYEYTKIAWLGIKRTVLTCPLNTEIRVRRSILSDLLMPLED